MGQPSSQDSGISYQQNFIENITLGKTQKVYNLEDSASHGQDLPKSIILGKAKYGWKFTNLDKTLLRKRGKSLKIR